MKKLAVLDLETDPFEYGKMVQPFVFGFYDGTVYTSIWGADCIERSITFLNKLPESHVIYAHNGGRFDFFWYIKYMAKTMRIVNSRIVQAYIGQHEIRDSYAIMPFPLEDYNKIKIDYKKFRKREREKHRQEIIDYLGYDCRDLYTLCEAFRKEFGDKLTIGGAAMNQLRKFHKFDSGNAEYDARIRNRFYFGGRNQCFKVGVIDTRVKVYDVNSMYPHVMDSFLHPVSTGIYEGNTIDDRTCFLHVRGKNRGAFPVRQKDNSLDFTVSSGEFYTTIHEYIAAIETGAFECQKIIRTYGYRVRQSFTDFVQHFFHARTRAKEQDDKIHALFYKYVLNSSYGKFAQNPENYADWFITEQCDRPPQWHVCSKSCDDPCRKRWTPSFLCEEYIIWQRPIKELNFFNVATGASITGASRAVLLRGLRAARNPLYCDTDSIICNDLVGVPISDTKLGAWKVECTGTRAAICGKKLYAVWNGSEVVKIAHKGAVKDRPGMPGITGKDILKIARGGSVESNNPVPAFKWDGSYSFTSRTLKKTGVVL